MEPGARTTAHVDADVELSFDFEGRFSELMNNGDQAGAKTLLEKAIDEAVSHEHAAAGQTTIAFAFDVDGVFIRAANRLENGPEVIRLLQKRRIPYIFLTNGGTKTEEDHAAKLGQFLGVDIEGKNFIQSHTPWLELVPRFKDKYILAVGKSSLFPATVSRRVSLTSMTGGDGNDCRDVAHAYGFTQVITPADIKAAYPSVYAFSKLESHAKDARPLPEHSDEYPIQIAAVLVWSSSRDWGLDMQVVVDVILSENGYLGTRASQHGASLPENGVEVHFCNADYTYASDYHLPRFAQGAFASALHGILHHDHGAKLEFTCIGKPTEATMLYAEKVLHQYHEELHAESGSTEPIPRIKTVYMVGDNPLSDISGANKYKSRYGSKWKSILVETGVHVAGTIPKVEPTVIVHGVKCAVEWGLMDFEYSKLIVDESEDENDEGDTEDEVVFKGKGTGGDNTPELVLIDDKGGAPIIIESIESKDFDGSSGSDESCDSGDDLAERAKGLQLDD